MMQTSDGQYGNMALYDARLHIEVIMFTINITSKHLITSILKGLW